MNRNLKKMCRAAVTAALYALLTLLLSPISYGPVQLRFSEALTLLPYLFPETAWGLTVGCLAANLLGGTVADALVGTLATLLAALAVGKMRRLYLTPLPVILCNGVMVGLTLALVTFETPTAWVALTVCASVAASEAVVTYVFGLPLVLFLHRLRGKTDFLS